MSKKLQAAIQNGEVNIRNKRGVEVSIWYRDYIGNRRVLVVGPHGTEELVPRLTDAVSLRWSSLKDAIRRGDIEVL